MLALLLLPVRPEVLLVNVVLSQQLEAPTVIVGFEGGIGLEQGSGQQLKVIALMSLSPSDVDWVVETQLPEKDWVMPI